MWLKLTGCVIVIISGAGIGFWLANRFYERPRQIQQLINCLSSLKSCINYLSSPLPEALVYCTNGVEGPVAQFFVRTAAILERSGWLTAREAMKIAFTDTQLALEKPEIELISALAANLGQTNREEQQKYIALVLEQLQKLNQEAVQSREQNVKMYRYLGICGGLAVVILLV